MKRVAKAVSLFIALLLLAQPAFANPIMPSPFQMINPVLAVPITCSSEIALRAFRAPGAAVYDAGILEVIDYAARFDILYSLEYNTYHNEPRLTVKDVRLTSKAEK